MQCVTVCAVTQPKPQSRHNMEASVCVSVTAGVDIMTPWQSQGVTLCHTTVAHCVTTMRGCLSLCALIQRHSDRHSTVAQPHTVPHSQTLRYTLRVVCVCVCDWDSVCPRSQSHTVKTRWGVCVCVTACVYTMTQSQTQSHAASQSQR